MRQRLTAAVDARVLAEPTAVFDLDGCLVHSSPDLHRALNASLARLGVTFTLVETECMMGHGLSALFEQAVAARGLALSRETSDALFAAFVASYEASPAELTTVRPFVVDAARALSNRGVRMAVCTNKAEPLALAILARFGLAELFHAIVGQVPGRARKPDAAPVHLAIAWAGGETSRAVMIGDSAADLGAARNAGIPCVLVTGGYGPDDVRTLGADAVAETADQVLSAVFAAVEQSAARRDLAERSIVHE